MIRTVLAALTLATPGAAEPIPVPVPSGQPVSLIEVLLDNAPGTLWARFRFLAPQIARDKGLVTMESAAPDMDHLCHAVALPYLDHHEIAAERVVVSLSDRVVPFGKVMPEATQFFETYRPDDNRCIWEGF